MDSHETSFDEVRARLDEIVEEVGAEGITLDEALSLYEEAVKLGLAACDLSEQDALSAAGMLDEQAAAAGEEASDAQAASDDPAPSAPAAPEATADAASHAAQQ